MVRELQVGKRAALHHGEHRDAKGESAEAREQRGGGCLTRCRAVQQALMQRDELRGEACELVGLCGRLRLQQQRLRCA